VYHLEDRPPRQVGHCDADGSVLLHREDDREEVIRERLEVYHQQTAPLVAFYEEAGLLLRVDSARPVELIRADLYEILDPLSERSGDTR
jgi:adenylate kinase